MDSCFKPSKKPQRWDICYADVILDHLVFGSPPSSSALIIQQYATLNCLWTTSSDRSLLLHLLSMFWSTSLFFLSQNSSECSCANSQGFRRLQSAMDWTTWTINIPGGIEIHTLTTSIYLWGAALGPGRQHLMSILWHLELLSVIQIIKYDPLSRASNTLALDPERYLRMRWNTRVQTFKEPNWLFHCIPQYTTCCMNLSFLVNSSRGSFLRIRFPVHNSTVDAAWFEYVSCQQRISLTCFTVGF